MTSSLDETIETDLDTDGDPISRRAPGDPLPGNVLAWERLGIGYRCETWLGWSRELWVPVVVKMPRPHQVEHSRARRTLEREAAALAGNPHPGLPRLLVDGSAAPLPYVVVEHLDGNPLDAEIDDGGAFAEVDVALLGAQLLSPLMALHARGLAHLDVKPDNVMLCHGRPMLIDFGSARRLGASQPQGRPIGSAGYAAPELEAGAPIDAGMDLYGVGAVLHEMLGGQPTFDPLLEAVQRPAPAALPHSALGLVVQSLLDPEPTRRLSTSATLHAFGRIAAALGREPWPAWAHRE
jgi:serine/threonine protein kinase